MSAAERILARLAAGQQVSERVVIVVAHPDDETLGMGAQLCRLADALLVHVTDGAPRDGEDARAYGFADVAEYAAARRAELAAALAAGGAARLRTLCLGIPDKEAMRDLAGLSRRLADLFSRERPAEVFTHAYEGGHPDHDAAAFAVHAACALIAIRPAILEMPLYHRRDGRLVTGEFIDPQTQIVIPGPSAGRNPESMNTGLWNMDSGFGPAGRPGMTREVSARGETVIPVSGEDQRRKQAMIDCYATQRWLLVQFDISAERFRPAPAYDFLAPPHPGALHYETLGWGISAADWRRTAAAALDALGPACG